MEYVELCNFDVLIALIFCGTPTPWLTRICFFDANFTNTTSQKILIPCLTRTVKHKFLHKHAFHFIELIPINLLYTKCT